MASARDRFQQLVSGIDYPMFVVTTAADGTYAGCLVGFLTQASLEPARILVCLSKANATFRVAQRAQALVVHFLGQGDADLARLFGEQTGDEVDKFAQCQWVPGPRELPVLQQCKGWVAATIVERFDCGDHVGYLVEPMAAETHRPDEPQLSFQQVRHFDPGHPA